ncbi:MAG: TraR/DksA family transcriptional regulator [Planctomycetales bacterium]|nr:TraR/DksA family transcriptional regulator [Planctomycetales bacterium]
MARQEDIAKLKRILISRRDALRKALAGDLSALKELREQSGGDAADFACDSVQDEISSQLAQVESRELSQIEHALKRMEQGTYGMCEVTGKPIPMARLAALPYATMCVEAQRELELRGSMPSDDDDWGRVLDVATDDSAVSLGDFDVEFG